MIVGISENQEQIIIEILKPHFKEFSFFYYGSRVKGGFEATSDLDILIKAKTNPKQTKISSAVLEEIKEKFDQSSLPFIVNFSEFAGVDERFYEMIRGDLVRVDWKKEKLHNLGFLGRGKSKHRPRNDSSLYGGNYPFVQTGDIKAANLYITEYGQTYNEKGLAQSKLWKSGTLCLTIAANIGETAILNIDACFPDSIVGFIADSKKANTKFIKYYIDTIKQQMSNISQGATQENMSLEKIGLFDLLIPPLPTQQKIASILSAYDDRIENNNRRIKILEEMAQELYKEWFVNFKFPNHQNTKFVESEFGKIPEGWEVVELGKKIEIRKGKNITKETVKEGNIPVVAGGLSPAYYHSEFNTEAPVITISASGANAGYVNLYHDKIWASDCSFIDKKSTQFVCFYYLFLKNKQIEITGLQRGSAQPHVYPKDLMALKIFNIPNNLISDFEEKILPIFLLLKNLSFKNQNLRQTRDLLLPRLISGEVSVENLDCHAEARGDGVGKLCVETQYFASSVK